MSVGFVDPAFDSFFAGYRVIESRNLRWDQVIVAEEGRMIVCGELGHVRWLLFRAAWREVVKRQFDSALAELHERVGLT